MEIKMTKEMLEFIRYKYLDASADDVNYMNLLRDVKVLHKSQKNSQYQSTQKGDADQYTSTESKASNAKKSRPQTASHHKKSVE